MYHSPWSGTNADSGHRWPKAAEAASAPAAYEAALAGAWPPAAGEEDAPLIRDRGRAFSHGP